MFYLHREVVDKAQPSSGVFEEHIQPLLERLAASLVEHIFRFERLINGQVNRIEGVSSCSTARRRWFLFHLFLFGVLLFTSWRLCHIVSFLVTSLLHRSRHPFMMCFAVSRYTPMAKKGSPPSCSLRFTSTLCYTLLKLIVTFILLYIICA